MMHFLQFVGFWFLASFTLGAIWIGVNLILDRFVQSRAWEPDEASVPTPISIKEVRRIHWRAEDPRPSAVRRSR